MQIKNKSVSIYPLLGSFLANAAGAAAAKSMNPAVKRIAYALFLAPPKKSPVSFYFFGAPCLSEVRWLGIAVHDERL